MLENKQLSGGPQSHWRGEDGSTVKGESCGNGNYALDYFMAADQHGAVLRSLDNWVCTCIYISGLGNLLCLMFEDKLLKHLGTTPTALIPSLWTRGLMYYLLLWNGKRCKEHLLSPWCCRALLITEQMQKKLRQKTLSSMVSYLWEGCLYCHFMVMTALISAETLKTSAQYLSSNTVGI